MKFFLKRTGVAIVILLSLLFAGFASAGDDFVFWPDADYDPAIPTFSEVLGYNPGERITWHANAIRYFEALAVAAPDRISVTPYAKSWEGRDLVYVVVTSPDNMARIDTIKSNMQRLADPRNTTPGEAKEIISGQPAVTWLSYGVILHFRVLHHWSGRRMAWLNLFAFALAVFTLYVVVMVLPTIHNFYMVGP